MTVPLFVWLVFVLDSVLLSERSPLPNTAFLGLALGVAVWVKYSFMALIPTLLLVFFVLWPKRRWKIGRFFATCVLSLDVSCALSIHSFWASSRAHGDNTEKHWAQKGIPPDMTYRDLLLVKTNDLRLFRAPEYFKREILLPHRYSYLGLSHTGVFTDPMNLFQDLSIPQNIGRVLIPDQKTRRAWKTPVMSASMSLGIIWTVSALIGTAWLLVSAFCRLTKGDLETPRLILSALLSFYLAAFLFIDRKIALRLEGIPYAVLLLVSIQCVTEVVMLI